MPTQTDDLLAALLLEWQGVDVCPSCGSFVGVNIDCAHCLAVGFAYDVIGDKRRPRRTVKASVGGSSVSDRLRLMLAADEPRVVRLLVSTWNAQNADLTYDEIEAALASGEIDPTFLQGFSDSYARMINDDLVPRWRAAGTVGAQAMLDGLRGLSVEPVGLSTVRARFLDWIDERSGFLLSNMTDQQSSALRSVVGHFADVGGATPAEIARLVRPLVGLTDGDALAVARRYSDAIADGVSVDDARSLAARYGGSLQRKRANRIARTELAAAFNRGQYDVLAEQVDAGNIGADAISKVWLTAEDERVCPTCGPLDGSTVGFVENFDSDGASELTPPIHPSCRCTLTYDIEL